MSCETTTASGGCHDSQAHICKTSTTSTVWWKFSTCLPLPVDHNGGEGDWSAPSIDSQAAVAQRACRTSFVKYVVAFETFRKHLCTERLDSTIFCVCLLEPVNFKEGSVGALIYTVSTMVTLHVPDPKQFLNCISNIKYTKMMV